MDSRAQWVGLSQNTLNFANSLINYHLNLLMNIDPLAPPSVAAWTIPDEEKMAAAKPPPQDESATSIQKSLEGINRHIDRFVGIFHDEGDISRVAQRLDEIATIMKAASTDSDTEISIVTPETSQPKEPPPTTRPSRASLRDRGTSKSTPPLFKNVARSVVDVAELDPLDLASSSAGSLQAVKPKLKRPQLENQALSVSSFTYYRPESPSLFLKKDEPVKLESALRKKVRFAPDLPVVHESDREDLEGEEPTPPAPDLPVVYESDRVDLEEEEEPSPPGDNEAILMIRHRPVLKRQKRQKRLVRQLQKWRSTRSILPADDADDDNVLNEPTFEEEATRLFHVCDANKDGRLELHEVLQNMNLFQEGGFLRTSEPEIFIRCLMRNRKVDFDDYMEMMRKAAAREVYPNHEPPTEQNHNAIQDVRRKLMNGTRNIFRLNKERIEKRVIGNDKWLFNPTGLIHISWEIFLSSLVITLFVTLPLTYAFGWESVGIRMLKAHVAMDVAFIVDIFKQFFTGYINDNEEVVMKRRDVMMHYVLGALVVDILSSVPFDLFFYLNGSMPGGAALLKLFRVAKFFRFRRVGQVFYAIGELSVYFQDKFNFRVTAEFAKLFRLFFLLAILAHWVGCMNFALVRAYHFPPDSWVVAAGLRNETASVQWRWSVYKALAQMILIGFETPPFTNGSCEELTDWCGIEHWVTLACLYIGAVFYSYLISSMLSMFQNGYLARRDFEDRLSSLDGYLRKDDELPGELRERIKRNFRLQHTNGMYYDDKIQRLITQAHLDEIRMAKAERMAGKVPLLKDARNKDFTKQLVLHLERVDLHPGDVIFEEGEEGDAMYFISKGSIALLIPSAGKEAQDYTSIGDGCFFGKTSILLGLKRTATAKAETQCLLFRVAKKALEELLDDFPEVAMRLMDVASARLNRVDHFVAPDRHALAENLKIDSEDKLTLLYKDNRAEAAANMEIN